jgi:hypothetical protein
MKFHRCAPAWVLVLSGFVAFAGVASGSVVMTPTSRTSAPAEELRARFDPSLEDLKAGRARDFDRLHRDDRANLQAAQDQSPALLDMRAGGAIEILLVVALVLLIVVLI